jgi:Family of unknown function (DUF5309)
MEPLNMLGAHWHQAYAADVPAHAEFWATQKGTVSTTDILADSLEINMVDELSMLDEDETQFTTFTMNTPTTETTREKVNWRESEYFPRLVTNSAIYTNVATTIVLTAGHGANVRVGDVLRNMAMGDAMWVTAVATDTLTVVRNVGTKAGAAGAVGDTFLIMSNAAAQGADFGQTAVFVPTLGFNYTQIFRHGYTFSRTATAVEYYGRGEPEQESAVKAVEHKRSLEYSGFWGARDVKTDPATGEPTGFAGGMVEFVTTFKQDVAGSLTVDYVDTFLKNSLQFASRNVVMYASPIAALQISKFNRGGQGTAWRASRENVAGLKVDAFMSGVYGYEIPVVVKKDWNDFPTTLKQYGGWVFFVDHDSVRWRPLRGASTRLLTGRANNGADRVSEEYLTEGTWEIRNEKHHAILYGIV